VRKAAQGAKGGPRSGAPYPSLATWFQCWLWPLTPLGLGGYVGATCIGLRFQHPADAMPALPLSSCSPKMGAAPKREMFLDKLEMMFDDLGLSP